MNHDCASAPLLPSCATTGEDTTHAVSVAQGDAVSIKLVSNDVADASEDVSATLVLT